MVDQHFYNADGELMFVPQQGSLRLVTEFGVITIAPGEIAVIPRGVKFRVELIDGPARGYLCENYGGAFTLPERGPIGANCLANSRDFLTPVAAYEDKDTPTELYVKWGGALYGDDAAAFADRRRGLARQLRAVQIRPAHLLAGRRHRLRSSRSVDLHRADLAVGDRRHREYRLRDLPRALDGGGEHVPAAVVSHEHHVGVHGADLRRLRRQAAGLRAGRRVAAQHDAAARPGSRGVRSCAQRRTEASEADRHDGLHVRDPLSAARHRICGRPPARCRTTTPIAGAVSKSASIRPGHDPPHRRTITTVPCCTATSARPRPIGCGSR